MERFVDHMGTIAASITQPSAPSTVTVPSERNEDEVFGELITMKFKKLKDGQRKEALKIKFLQALNTAAFSMEDDDFE